MWVLPSRSRPSNCARLFAAGIATPGVLCVDDDDPRLDEYANLRLPVGWYMEVGKRAGLSEIYNRALYAHPSEFWYGVLADDVVPETPAWDRALIHAALPDGMAFGDDGINGGKHATHFVLAGKLVRDIGWLALPGLDRIFIDTTWNRIAEARRVRCYLPDVKLTHRHPSNGTAKMDRTYRKHRKAEDKAIYEAWKNDPATGPV